MYFPCCPDEAPGRPLPADISIFGDSDTTTNSDTRTGRDAKGVMCRGHISGPKSFIFNNLKVEETNFNADR